MIDQIIQFGLIKLAAIFVITFLWTIYKCATQPIDNGWSTVLHEPLHKRVLNRLRRRGSTSVEVRKH